MEEVKNVKERLIKFLKYKKLSQSKFEKMCGLGNGYVNNIRSAIGPNKIPNIIRQFPELNIAWLLLGEQYGGPMLKEEAEMKPEKRETPSRGEHALPLIPFDAVAGPGDPVYEDERVENYYSVSEFKESDFLIRVKGDSMSPHFTGGDLLACKKVVDTYFFQWGRGYVIYTQSEGCMVKRIQHSDKEGYIRCVSDNVKYAPFDVPMDDIVSIALVNGSISLE